MPKASQGSSAAAAAPSALSETGAQSSSAKRLAIGYAPLNRSTVSQELPLSRKGAIKLERLSDCKECVCSYVCVSVRACVYVCLCVRRDANVPIVTTSTYFLFVL